MDTPDHTISMKALAVSTAMAGALLSGCATSPAPRADVSATQAQEALAEGRVDRGVRLAEQAVQAEPRNAEYRAVLGKAYLDAGRFASAETSYADAMALGDNSPRTALSLALSLTAQAKYDQAATLLNQWEGQIATADLGLALALSGQPERGIHLMSNAIRGGDNSVKMRQNLAYAYAVAGRWREARLMAAQDVPADQVGARMEQWASLASHDAYQLRVARLLGVPSGVRDAGQPTHLALVNNPGLEQLAAEASSNYAQAAPAPAPQAELAALDSPMPALAPAPAPASVAFAAPAIERFAVPASGGELPAPGRPAAAGEAPQSEFARAFSTATPSGNPLTQVTLDASRFAAQPLAQSTPERRTAARTAGEANARPAASRGAPTGERATAGISGDSHLVQLGSFASEQGARRAWTIYVSRYPELANHEMVITEAVVRGKRYYRVSAGGFDLANSRAMCRTVDARGGDGCISWAAASPLPGALPSRRDDGVRLARRD